MTVSVETNYVIHQGNGVATVFPYTFRIPTNDMVWVAIQDRATGVIDTVLTLGADFTITGISWDNYSGGNVTYPLSGTPLPTTKNIVIMRKVTYTQQLDLFNQGGFYPESLEQQLDLIVFQTQQIAEECSRAVKVLFGKTAQTLPIPQENYILSWDNLGTLVNKSPAEFINLAGVATAAQGALADSALQPTGSLNTLTYDRGVTGSVRKAFEVVVGPDTVNWREFLELDGTDETAKMQAFVNACANKRGICTGGIVKTSAPIILPNADNFLIEGVGCDPNGTSASVIFNTNTAAGNAIQLIDTAFAGADKYRKLARLAVFGNQNSGSGIVLDRAVKMYLDELWLSSHGGSGLYAYRTFSSKLYRVTSVANGSWGVYYNEQANNVSMTQCIVNGNSRNSGNGNIFFNGSAGLENLGVLIQDSDFTGAGTNKYGGGGHVAEAYNLLLAHTYAPTVQNCYSELVGSPTAAGRLFYAGPTCRGLTMANNYWQDGIVELDGAREVRVENNLFQQITVATVCKVNNSGIDQHEVARNIFTGGAYYSLLGTLAPYLGWGSAAPVTGTWRVGDKIQNTAPVAGGSEGWVCTTAGTPGTWKTYGTISV